jgi:hypothetical protein
MYYAYCNLSSLHCGCKSLQSWLKSKPVWYFPYANNVALLNFAPASVCAHKAMAMVLVPWLLTTPGGKGNRV